MTAWEQLYLFLERGEAADGLKGYLLVNGQKGEWWRERTESEELSGTVPTAAQETAYHAGDREEREGWEEQRGFMVGMRTSAYQGKGLFEWQYKKTRAWREIWGMMGNWVMRRMNDSESN